MGKGGRLGQGARGRGIVLYLLRNMDILVLKKKDMYSLIPKRNLCEGCVFFIKKRKSLF